MADEAQLPDDGKPRRHLYRAPDGHLTFVANARAMTRSEAVDHLRRQPPRELGPATTVELFDDEGGAPFRELGATRIQYTPGELVRSVMGTQVSVSPKALR